MSDARSLLDRITSTVNYLRVTIDPTGPEWLACAPLVTNPDDLAALVATTMAGRGTDRIDVATSLFVQGYAFRIASLTIGGWLLDGAIINTDPTGSFIAIGRDRPNAVGLRQPQIAAAAGSLGALHENLIEEHLALLVDTAHQSCRVGEPLLWGNIAAGCASSFGAFAGELSDRRDEIREHAAAFFESARPEVADAGRLVPVGARFAWERKSCCLWYLTESGFKCEDCSLWTSEEREARYAAALEAEAEAPG